MSNKQKFRKFIESDNYIYLQKNISEVLDNEIINNMPSKEIPLVEHKIIPKLNISLPYIEIKSEFIHNKKSWVSSNHKLITTKREIGDILLSVMLADNNNIILHKITFVQVKMDNLYHWTPDQGEKEQLMILSRFPNLIGESGIFKKGEKLNFLNKSKCLGSYFFVSLDSGIEFSSAYLLDLYINNELLDFREILTHPFFRFCFPFFGKYPKSMIFKNTLYSPNTYDFTDNLLKLNIGELIYSEDPSDEINKNVQGIFKRILKHIESKKDKKQRKFLDYSKKVYDLNNSNPENVDHIPGDDGIILINFLVDITNLNYE